MFIEIQKNIYNYTMAIYILHSIQSYIVIIRCLYIIIAMHQNDKEEAVQLTYLSKDIMSRQ